MDEHNPMQHKTKPGTEYQSKFELSNKTNQTQYQRQEQLVHKEDNKFDLKTDKNMMDFKKGGTLFNQMRL